MNNYPNQIVFHLLILDKRVGWVLHSVYSDFASAKVNAKKLINSFTCRIDEISYRNVYEQIKQSLK